MKTKVELALLCDSHLPLRTDTPAYGVFDLALKASEGCDCIFTLGDITAHGNPDAMTYFLQKMENTGIPWAAVPGNAELRDPETKDRLLAALESPLREKPIRFASVGWTAVLLDCSDYGYPEPEREKLKKAAASLGEEEYLMLLQHQGPGDLAAESREFLKEVLLPIAKRCVIIYGHKHRFGPENWEGIPAFKLQALDPDKAIGTPPMSVRMVLEPKGKWTPVVCEHRCWSGKAVKETVERLGLSCFCLPKDLDYAITHGVRAIELRHGNMRDLPEEELLGKIAEWRAAGGEYLSLHVTEPEWNNGELVRKEKWLDSARWAKKIGADAITLHVPKVPVGQMKDGSPVRREVKALCLEGFSLLDESCDIHIENMHMGAGEKDDPFRRFGYLPCEVKGWIEELQREYHRPEKISFLLDVGHARNNPPYSSVYTMGMWYAMMGKMTDACHMHQVMNSPEGMKNHQPITDIYGPLINFSGFLSAWEAGLIRPRTVFLEVRSLENYLVSLETWKNFSA